MRMKYSSSYELINPKKAYLEAVQNKMLMNFAVYQKREAA